METQQCSYCKRRQLTVIMANIQGLWFCNRGHFREYIRMEKQHDEVVQMDMFPKTSEQQKPTASSASMLDCPHHRTFQYQCRVCNPR